MANLLFQVSDGSVKLSFGCYLQPILKDWGELGSGYTLKRYTIFRFVNGNCQLGGLRKEVVRWRNSSHPMIIPLKIYLNIWIYPVQNAPPKLRGHEGRTKYIYDNWTYSVPPQISVHISPMPPRQAHVLFSSFGIVTCYVTRMQVNVRLHMMFRPELIYIFDLIVNLMMR